MQLHPDQLMEPDLLSTILVLGSVLVFLFGLGMIAISVIASRPL